MSLSFVASAVLSSTDGISHNEEKEIENREVDAVRKRNTGSNKSLFEQLRENQDKQEESFAEQQRAIMRGTLALDEEDAAHLNALNKSKMEMERKRKTEMEQELAMFRAAKEERRDGQVVIDEDDQQQQQQSPQQLYQATIMPSKVTPAPFVPKIVAKRRRKHVPENDEPTSKKMKDEEKEQDKGLSGLLGDYGSSSDED